MPANKKNTEPEVVDIAALVGDESLTEVQPPAAPKPQFTAVEDGGGVISIGAVQPAVTATGGGDVQEADRLKERIKELEHALALDTGRREPVTELEKAAEDSEPIVIHIVSNGLSALGQIWYVGQELEFDPAGKAYEDTKDKLGRSWLDLRYDENAQVDKYGEVKFRSGPWRGKSYEAAAGAPLEFPLKPIRDGDAPILPPTQSELHAATQAEASRGRAVPRLTVR